MEKIIAHIKSINRAEIHVPHPSCLEAIHRIIERNNGIIIGEYKEEENEQ